MGLAFISSKRDGFEHRRDAAKEAELCSPNLLSALPEDQVELFRCETTRDGVHLRLGEQVLVTANDEGGIVVLQVNRVIGRLLPAGEKKLRTILAQYPGQMLPAAVAKVPKLGNRFSIQVENFRLDA